MQELKTLMAEWNDKFFQGKLKDVSLHFYQRRSNTKGFFRRRFLSREIHINTCSGMFQPRTLADHQHTLLHEMVHAYLAACNRPCGHTPLFKSMLRDLTEKTFGIRPQSNMRYVVNLQGATLVRPASPVAITPTPAPIATLPKTVVMAGRYKVISTGKVGTFLRESMVYGKKHIVLTIDGGLFPFTTAMDNVVAI